MGDYYLAYRLRPNTSQYSIYRISIQDGGQVNESFFLSYSFSFDFWIP